MRPTRCILLASLLITPGCHQDDGAAPLAEKEISRGEQSEPAEIPSQGSTRLAGNLPEGWTETEVIEVDLPRTAQVAARLGAKITRLKNVIYKVDGERFQLNTILCPDEGNARRIAAALLVIHGGVDCRCLRQGNVVYEFVCQDLRMVERAYRDLGMTAATVNYDVAFQVAPLEEADPMLWNRLFNACMKKQEAEIEALLPSFRFGNRLRVRLLGQGSEESRYQFDPNAKETFSLADAEVLSHVFAEVPRSLGVPRVNVRVQVSSTGFFTSESTRQHQQLVVATTFWPCGDEQIVRLREQIITGRTSPDERLQRLLDWFADSGNIRYDGTVVGSRYGVAKVLQQRFGHCWDYSDLFITLARAADIPCRQVYGWLYGQSGHVWVEVLTAKGWRAIDPTAGMGCDSRYIPLFVSEDGRVDFVYTTMPNITVIGRP